MSASARGGALPPSLDAHEPELGAALRAVFPIVAGDLAWRLDPASADHPLRADADGLFVGLDGHADPARLWSAGALDRFRDLVLEGELRAIADDWRAVVAALPPAARARVRPSDLFSPRLMARLCAVPRGLRRDLLAGPARLGRLAHDDWQRAFGAPEPGALGALDDLLAALFPVVRAEAELRIAGRLEARDGWLWVATELRIFDPVTAPGERRLWDVRPQTVRVLPIDALRDRGRTAGYLRALRAWLDEWLAVHPELGSIYPADLLPREVFPRDELTSPDAFLQALLARARGGGADNDDDDDDAEES